MATSGTTSFTMTRDQIIYSAARKLSVVGDGQSLSSTQITNASLALNALLKTFEADGMPLWAIADYTFALTATQTYPIGVGLTLDTPAPLKITQAILNDSVALTNIPLNIVTRYDYNLLPNSGTTSPPNTLEYEPGNQTGVIKIWPLPDTDSITNKTITITYQRPFEDMVSGADNFDFPQFWLDAIIYGLAVRLAPEYSTPLPDRQLLIKEAEAYHASALSFGTEEGSLFLQPNWIRY